MAMNNRRDEKSNAMNFLGAFDKLKTKKVCYFKQNKIEFIDFKDIELLKKFINPRGKIIPRAISGTSAKYQRQLSKAVKRARIVALLPYIQGK